MRKEIQALEEDEVNKRDALEAELLQLIKLDEFAKKRILAYKTDHANLQHQPETIILTLDFTSAQTSMETDFNDCVVVIATQVPLVIPPALAGHLIAAEEPPAFIAKPDVENEGESEERPKKARRTKQEMEADGIVYAKPRDNLRSYIEEYSKRNQAPRVCIFCYEFLVFSLNSLLCSSVRKKWLLNGSHALLIFIFCLARWRIEVKFLRICNGC